LVEARFFLIKIGVSAVRVSNTPLINDKISQANRGKDGDLKSKKDSCMGCVFSVLNPIAIPNIARDIKINQNFKSLNNLIILLVVDTCVYAIS